MSEQTSEQAYKTEYDSFMSIPKTDLVYCNKPLNIGTAEGVQLGMVVIEDRQMLLDAGMEAVWADSLLTRAKAFEYAAAKYELVANADPEVRKAWEELSPMGYEVQRYLIRMYGFAFRKDDSLSDSVDKLQEGRGDKDMILDLLSAHILGSENKETLGKMKMFEMAKIDEAKDLHDKLSNLYARSNIDPKQISEAKDILYRAYTHYKQAADQVIEHGRFVFEGTERYDSYVSSYHKGTGKKSDKPKDQPKPNQPL